MKQINENKNKGEIMNINFKFKTLKSIREVVTISPGNSKTGLIPSVSQKVGETCNPEAPCQFKGGYCLKERRHPSCMKARQKNLDSYQNDPDIFFSAINSFIKIKDCDYFRWSVVGDIVDQSYLEYMVAIAIDNPNCNFTTYTKKYDLNFSKLPKNLVIRISTWPGFDYSNHYGLPMAYMDDGKEDRIPKKFFTCPGNCISCKKTCWNPKVKNIVFMKH